MRVKTIAKLAVTLMLGASLAACVDGTVEVTVTGENSARATITQVMGADFYAMVKRSAEQGEAVTDDFCGEGELTGTRQSGMARFRFARLPEDAAVLERAFAVAEDLLRADPELERPEHELLRAELARAEAAPVAA